MPSSHSTWLSWHTTRWGQLKASDAQEPSGHSTGEGGVAHGGQGTLLWGGVALAVRAQHHPPRAAHGRGTVLAGQHTRAVGLAPQGGGGGGTPSVGQAGTGCCCGRRTGHPGRSPTGGGQDTCRGALLHPLLTRPVPTHDGVGGGAGQGDGALCEVVHTPASTPLGLQQLGGTACCLGGRSTGPHCPGTAHPSTPPAPRGSAHWGRGCSPQHSCRPHSAGAGVLLHLA